MIIMDGWNNQFVDDWILEAASLGKPKLVLSDLLRHLWCWKWMLVADTNVHWEVQNS